MTRTRAIALMLAAAAMWLVLGVLNVHLADLNQDEGWYLYAAGEVAEGRWPFVDFAYTQGPVMPAVYGALHGWMGSYGVEGGRWLTLGWGGAALVLACVLGGRVSPVGWGWFGAAVTAILLGVNVYHSAYTSTVKTYALCTALLMGGMVLVRAAASVRRPWFGILGGLLLGLAAGTRLSAGIVLAIVCFSLLFRPAWRRTHAWFFVGLGGAAGLTLAYGPFLFAAPEAVRFGLLEYHGARGVEGTGAALMLKAGSVSRFAGAYFVAACTAVALLLLAVLRPAKKSDASAGPPSLTGLLWGCGLALFLVHLSAPFPYDDYQVVTAPLFCTAIAGSLAGWMSRRAGEGMGGWAGWVGSLLLVTCIGAAFSSPINQNWVLSGRDVIWWPMKEEAPLRRLQWVGAEVREASGGADVLLTQDTYLAVEAGLRVPSGLEMGPFSYHPGLSTEEAEALHLMNRERMLELLRTSTAPVAAFSEYGLAIASPAIERVPPEERAELESALLQRYEPWKEISEFGQGLTDLRLYRLRSDDVEAAE